MMGLARRHRTVATSLIYAAIATAALALAYVTRNDFEPRAIWNRDFGAALAVLIAIRLVVNYLLRLGMGQWRYVGNRDYVRLVVAETVGSVAFFGVTAFTPLLPYVPLSVVLLEWAFNGYGTAMTWVLYRLLFERYQVRQAGSRTRVLIVGGGEAGELLVSQMMRSRVGYLPVGIVDDNPVKWGTHVHGVQVVGPTSEVAEYALELSAEEIVIGIPSASANDLRRIVQSCEATQLPLKILPGMEEVLTGTATLSRVRDVRVEDLLGRDPFGWSCPRWRRSWSTRSSSLPVPPVRSDPSSCAKLRYITPGASFSSIKPRRPCITWSSTCFGPSRRSKSRRSSGALLTRRP